MSLSANFITFVILSLFQLTDFSTPMAHTFLLLFMPGGF